MYLASPGSIGRLRCYIPDSRQLKAFRGEMFGAEINEVALGVPRALAVRPGALRVDDP